MKILGLFFAFLLAFFLTGCAVAWTTPKGDRFSVGFTPSPEHLNSLKGYAK